MKKSTPSSKLPATVANTESNTIDKSDEEAPLEPVSGLSMEHTFKAATYTLFGFQLFLILLLGVNGGPAFIEDSKFTSVYQFNTGVSIMMFFGFGYLMTFLKRYGMGAVGFTMMITVVALQWGIFCDWFFKNWETKEWGYIPMNIMTFTDGLDLVAALLISFGGLIGKVGPYQLLLMTIFETIFYAFNKCIWLEGTMDFADAGGSIQIHMFGAYFGLAASIILGKPTTSTEGEVSHVSDLFSMIGTLFLWIYWPSFNGGNLDPNSHPQQRAVINTILSLCAATVATFATSSFLNGSYKIRPVDIQNATLAGGVAIGASANLTLNPSAPLIIGMCAGTISTYGFARLQPYLETNWGLHDTCGIHNLHGIPSLIGGFASVFIMAHKGSLGHDMPAVFTHADQGGRQFGAILLTLLTAIPTGIITGFIMKKLGQRSDTLMYSDFPYWEVEDHLEEGHGKAAAEGDEEQGLPPGSVDGKYDRLRNSNHEAEFTEGDAEVVQHIKL